MHLMKYITVFTNREGTFCTDAVSGAGNFCLSAVG